MCLGNRHTSFNLLITVFFYKIINSYVRGGINLSEPKHFIKDKKIIEAAENLLFQVEFEYKKYNRFGRFIFYLEFLIFFLKLLIKEPLVFFDIVKEMNNEYKMK